MRGHEHIFTRILTLALLLALGGCARDIVILLPDETTEKSAVTVTTVGGSTELNEPNTAVTLGGPGDAPGTPQAIPEAEIQRQFGKLLAVPAVEAPTFLLYFESGGKRLTESSRERISDIVSTVRYLGTVDLEVVGHTDTRGDASANARLGLQRAERIRDLLVGAGLDPDRISVSSHGERNLLVPTADGVDELRNRRVEVAVH